MSMVEVDNDKCIGCEQCAQVCPHDCFVIEDKKSQVAHTRCFKCGHCLAACPAGAIFVEGLAQDLHFKSFNELEGITVPKDGELAQLVRLMRSRRSVRNYTDQPVALELLQDLVKIGTTAPSGTNSQLWSFSILEHRKDVMALGDGVAQFFKKLNKKAGNPLLRGLAKIFAGDSLGRYYRTYYKSIQQGLDGWFGKGEDHLFHGATSVIFVGCSKKASCPVEDALLATGQMILAAHQMGLGTCLIGFVVEAIKHEKSLQQLVGLGTDEEIYAVIGLGYSTEKYSKPAPRKAIKGRVLKLAG